MNPKQVRPENEDIASLSRFLIYFSINLAKVNFLSIFWRKRALGLKLFAGRSECRCRFTGRALGAHLSDWKAASFQKSGPHMIGEEYQTKRRTI